MENWKVNPRYAKHLRSRPSSYTVRKILEDFAVTDDEKFSKIKRNGRKFRHIELSNSVISYIF